MLPVLGFFNKTTEWRLFPEYSLEISDDKKNITLSIEGASTNLTIPNENLAKKSDEIIDDAIKNNFVIKKKFLNENPQFKELIEKYNDPEWIPTILMINSKIEIDFKTVPVLYNLSENVMNQINKVLYTLSDNVQKLINDALNSKKGGGKRNPDRERIYKLPIQKRRTDNYYNYE